MSQAHELTAQLLTTMARTKCPCSADVAAMFAHEKCADKMESAWFIGFEIAMKLVLQAAKEME